MRSRLDRPVLRPRCGIVNIVSCNPCRRAIALRLWKVIRHEESTDRSTSFDDARNRDGLLGCRRQSRERSSDNMGSREPRTLLRGSEDCTGLSPRANSHTFVFDGNNSINIKRQRPEPVVIEVELIPIRPDYLERSGFREHCSPTLSAGLLRNGGCTFYRVISTPNLVLTVSTSLDSLTPAAKGNKHDLMLLRSEDEVIFDDRDHHQSP